MFDNLQAVVFTFETCGGYVWRADAGSHRSSGEDEYIAGQDRPAGYQGHAIRLGRRGRLVSDIKRKPSIEVLLA